MMVIVLALQGCGKSDPDARAARPTPSVQQASSPASELELGCGSAYADPVGKVLDGRRGSAKMAGVILVGLRRSGRWREVPGVGVVAKLPLIMPEGAEATIAVRGVGGTDVSFLTPRQAEAGSAVTEGVTRVRLFGCQMVGSPSQKPAKHVFYGIYLAASRAGCAELEVTRSGKRTSTPVRMGTNVCPPAA